jgi:hypothetical protein
LATIADYGAGTGFPHVEGWEEACSGSLTWDNRLPILQYMVHPPMPHSKGIACRKDQALLIFPRAKGKHFKEGQSDLSLFVTYFPFREGRGEGGGDCYCTVSQRGKIKQWAELTKKLWSPTLWTLCSTAHLQLTNSVSKTSKTKVVAIFSGTNYYYYYYVVVKGRHSNWLVSEQGRSGVPEPGGGDPKP